MIPGAPESVLNRVYMGHTLHTQKLRLNMDLDRCRDFVGMSFDDQQRRVGGPCTKAALQCRRGPPEGLRGRFSGLSVPLRPAIAGSTNGVLGEGIPASVSP